MADLFSVPGDATDYQCPTPDTFDFPELHGPLIIDTENHDPLLIERGSGWAYDRFGQDGGKIIGIAVKCDNFHEYLPIGHTEGNLDPLKVKAWLKHQVNKDRRQPKIFANIMYDAGWFEAEGMEIHPDNRIEDVMYQAPLIDENRMAYSLDRLGKDFLGIGKDEKGLLEAGKILGVKNSKKDNVKKHLMRIHPNIVGLYAKQDVEVTDQLWRHFSPIIDEQNLNEVYQLEMDLVPMHIAMRMRGVRVNVEEAEKRQDMLLKKEKIARSFIKEATGIDVASWDNADELAAVFKKVDIEVGVTATGRPSITQGWLRSLQHPISDAILNGRKSSNIRSTFIENSLLNLQQRGRVFPNFNQLRKDSDDGAAGVIGKAMKTTSKGTVSGRYSSSSPNFQQMPSPERDYETGMTIRELFLPEEGQLWHGLDYSSQEPRGIVHFAELTNCPGASRMADRFRDDPDTDIHLENAKLIIAKRGVSFYGGEPKKARKPTKTIGLGIAYGMGGGKLCVQLDLPYTEAHFYKGDIRFDYLKAGPEGQEIMDAFDEAAPYIRALANKCQNAVRRKGYIVTPIGRRFRFPKGDDGRYMFLNKALNRLIQGTSADMTKLAMRELWREGILPLGTVHDEIDFSESDPERIKRAKHIMENALPMTIPIRVDVGTGPNWGSASVPDVGSANYEAFLRG